MGTDFTCRFSDGTRAFRHRDPVNPERCAPSRSLRRASSGAHRHVRNYRMAWTGNCIETCPARRAHRHRWHAHVRRSHARKAGTMAIHCRQRVEGCWRRRWWSGPGAAAGRDKLADDARCRGRLSKLLIPLALLGFLPAVCIPVLAHHGSASYKTDKVVVMKHATVTKFLWANPHTMLLFDVKDDNGNISHWAGEAGSPSAIRLLGWNKKSLQPGDVITVHLYPSKFESNVGRVDKIVLADGTTLKDSPRGDLGVLSRY